MRAGRDRQPIAVSRVFDTRSGPTSLFPGLVEPIVWARRGIESGARPGRHRWKVERALARLNRFRRLAVRYERRADIHLAFATLGCALVCLNQIRRLC
jgi:Transposase DDE domain